MDNPILNFLCKSDGSPKNTLKDDGLRRFKYEEVFPARSLIIQTLDLPLDPSVPSFEEDQNTFENDRSNDPSKSLAKRRFLSSSCKINVTRENPDPSMACSRDNLIHLWNLHFLGYLPLGDLAFLSDQELDCLHHIIPHHVFKFFRDSLGYLDPNKTKVLDCIRNLDFLTMALMYEVLPHVGEYLKGHIKTEECLSDKIQATFQRFQLQLNTFTTILNPEKEKLDLKALARMNYKIFSRANQKNSDGSIFHPEFTFGPQNNGDPIHILNGLETYFLTIINEGQKPDHNIPYRYYRNHGGDLSSTKEKIELFVEGMRWTRIARSIVQCQHALKYSSSNPSLSGKPCDENLGDVSNRHFLSFFSTLLGEPQSR